VAVPLKTSKILILISSVRENGKEQNLEFLHNRIRINNAKVAESDEMILNKPSNRKYLIIKK